MAYPMPAQSPRIFNPQVVRAISAQLPTFVASGLAAAGYATPQDLFTLHNPADSTKLIRVQSMNMAIAATAAITAPSRIDWILRRTLNTGGTATNPTPISLSGASATPLGVVSIYTAAPTSGTNLVLSSPKLVVPALGTSVPALFSLTARTLATTTQSYVDAITLRPGEMVAGNWAGAAITSGWFFDWDIQWTEEPL